MSKAMSDRDVVEQVRDRYAAAARAAMGTGRRTLDVLDDLDGGGGSCCGGDGCCSGTAETQVFGSALYNADQAGQVPELAVLASLGCGNPTAVAELAPGERKKAKVGSTRSADDVRRPGECEQGEECVCNCVTKMEQPQDEPTPLARICALAAEIEALAVRRGYIALVNIDAYDECPKLRLSIRPKGASE